MRNYVCLFYIFFAIFILKCVTVVVSSVWLVIALIEFVIVCRRVDRRMFIFFSSNSISDFRCESLILFTFYVSCQVSLHSNERELDRLFFFAFFNDSLDFNLDLFESFNKCATSVGHEIY